MISVVVAIYNIKEEYLRKCIESLINQTNKNFELILIDDGSTNNNNKIIDLYKNTPNIKIVHKNNEGVSVARNIGINLSSGEWITFVDGDDYCELNMIETMYKYLNDNTDILIYSCYVNYSNIEIKNSFLPYKKKNNVNKEELIMQVISKNYSKFYPVDTSVAVPWAKLYRKNFLLKNNIKFVKGMIRMQDAIFNLYTFENASLIIYIDKPVYHYLKNKDSVVNKYSPKTMSYYSKMFDETEKYLLKYRKDKIYFEALNLVKLLSIENYIVKYYFNKNNNNSYNKSKKEIIKIINECSFDNINYNILNIHQKIYMYLLVHKNIFLLKYFLKLKYSIKNLLRRIN